VSQTALFLGLNVRQKRICEKSKIYKNSQNDFKIKKTLNSLQKQNSWQSKYTSLIILNDIPICQVAMLFMNSWQGQTGAKKPHITLKKP
jgi:hypothetical protein